MLPPLHTQVVFKIRKVDSLENTTKTCFWAHLPQRAYTEKRVSEPLFAQPPTRRGVR